MYISIECLICHSRHCSKCFTCIDFISAVNSFVRTPLLPMAQMVLSYHPLFILRWTCDQGPGNRTCITQTGTVTENLDDGSLSIPYYRTWSWNVKTIQTDPGTVLFGTFISSIKKKYAFTLTLVAIRSLCV